MKKHLQINGSGPNVWRCSFSYTCSISSIGMVTHLEPKNKCIIGESDISHHERDRSEQLFANECLLRLGISKSGLRSNRYHRVA